MPLPTSLPKPPQTAADLLEGLSRSQLFAESLFGQVMEQSAPYLERRADEYAAAIVDKKVLTPWQATELLAGRSGLYAGTFRLFERLAGTASAEVFVAEQPGPQRLVVLEVTRLEGTPATDPIKSGGAGHIDLDATAKPHARPEAARHPHMARCLGVQHTPRLRLVAYEFMEAKPLAELLARNPPARKHAANLILQFSEALVVLCDEALAAIGPEAAWVDGHGELKLLAGPHPLASVSQLSQSSTERVALQMGAIQRFAAALGGLPEIENCRAVNEVLQRLVGIAKPWTEPFARESLRCPRVEMNRLLRRGPSLRWIESFGPELQVALAKLSPETGREADLEGGSELGSEAVTSESPASGPAATTAVEGHSLATMAMAPAPAPKRPKVGSGRRAFAFTVLVWLLASGVVVTQWFQQRGVRRANATTDPAVSPEPQPPVTPAP